MKFTPLPAAMVFLLLACKTELAAWKQYHFTEVIANEPLSESRLPRELWNKIRGTLSEKLSKDEGRGTLPTVFVPLKVYFIEKNNGILQRGHTVVQLAAGGGELDLSDIVRDKNGSFYLAVEFLPEMENAQKRVYFLSNGKQRRIGGETVGAGCNIYFDLSKTFEQAMKKNGFLLNTSEGRHVSALAGTYFFAAAKGDKLYLSALRIKDSKRKFLQCR